jgi:hypothetical protein
MPEKTKLGSVISFGRQNTGMQIGLNHGAISGIAFGIK